MCVCMYAFKRSAKYVFFCEKPYFASNIKIIMYICMCAHFRFVGNNSYSFFALNVAC